METNELNNNDPSSKKSKNIIMDLAGFFKNKVIPKLFNIKIPIIAIVLIAWIFSISFNKPSMKTTIISIMQSKETISQLSALQVPYGGIYIEKNEKGEEIDRCLYKGSVKYSIDFSKIKVSEQDNTIKVEIPNVELQEKDVFIDPVIKWLHNENRYINNKEKEIELCKGDIIDQYKNNSDTRELAEQSVGYTIKNLITPIVDGISKQYKVEVYVGGRRIEYEKDEINNN